MDPNRNESVKTGAAMGGNSPGGPSVTNSLARGKDVGGAAAAHAMDQAADDLKALRHNLNKLTTP
jgi:succinate dehydrogenase/fumarate reductase flavoprotein subunit